MVKVELSQKIWKIFDNNFRLNNESDSEILFNIIKNHLVQNEFYPDADSLQHGNGLKDIVDLLDDKIMSVIEILERNRLTTSQEFKEIMQERIIKNAGSFN